MGKDGNQRAQQRIVSSLRLWVVCEEGNTIQRVPKSGACLQNRGVVAALAAPVADGFRRGRAVFRASGGSRVSRRQGKRLAS